MAVLQKVVTVRSGDGQYYNFFFTPGSWNSLEQYLAEGWVVRHINDDQKSQHASILFEKVVSDD